MKQITIACREISKKNGDITSYIVKKNASGSDVTFFRLRGTFNPELTYYAFVDEGNAETNAYILEVLQRKNLSSIAIEANSLVKL